MAREYERYELTPSLVSVYSTSKIQCALSTLSPMTTHGRRSCVMHDLYQVPTKPPLLGLDDQYTRAHYANSLDLNVSNFFFYHSSK